MTIVTVQLPQAKLPVLSADGTFNLPWYRTFQQFANGGGSIDPSIIATIEGQIATLAGEIKNFQPGTGITFTSSGGATIISVSSTTGVNSVQGLTGDVVLTEREISGLVSITDYGAKCDGNPVTETGTNDTAAWTNAIADINANVITGVIVPGYSFVSGALPTITNRVYMLGPGPGSAGIIQTSAANVITLSFDSTGAATTQQALTKRFIIEGLYIGTLASNTGQAMKMHCHNSNYGNIISNCIVSGWPNHQTSPISGNRYGFAKNVELINVSSSYFTNIFMQGYHDPGLPFPSSNLVTSWGWSVWAEAAKGSFNNRWVSCDVAACNIGWYMPSGNLQGMFFESANPGICGYGWQIIASGISNPPCFEWVDCQSEVFYDSINCTNISYVMVTNCQHYLDNNLVFDRCGVRLNNVVYASLQGNQVVGALGGSGTSSGLIATDCDQIVSSFNNINGLSAYGIRFNGTTSNSSTCHETIINPNVSATPFKNDSTNNTTNSRRDWIMTGATQAQGQSPQTGNNVGATTLLAAGTTIVSAASIGVEVGDRIQVQIATDIVRTATDTFTQVLVKETNHGGTTVLNFCVDQKNWTRYGSLVNPVARADFYETIEFDIVAAEPDAIISLIGFSGSSDASANRGQIVVKRL